MLDSPPVLGSDIFKDLRKRTRNFEKKFGRCPRILLTHMTQKDHPVESMALGYADAGFDVDICPRLQSVELLAKMAVENDVHVIGILVSETGRKNLSESLVRVLTGYGADDIRVKMINRHPAEATGPFSRICAGDSQVPLVRDTLDLIEP